MNNWHAFCAQINLAEQTIEQLRDKARLTPGSAVYPESLQQIEDVTLFMAREAAGPVLVIYPVSAVADRFHGEDVNIGGGMARVCPTDLANCRCLRELFPFTRPVSHKGRKVTIGLGDRLGLASPGHLRTIRGLDVFPVLAQQSIRELNLTGRNYDDVLAAASWAVFQEGYEAGFGADGDHLKTEQEVRMALECGVTMITLDCSEQIANDVPGLSDDVIAQRYLQIPDDERAALEQAWLDRTVR
ncbi:MAG: tagaturonate epimerase family protein, partial [Clostridiales bacterium]|nr:tagaturonate epimerase family protein [Clostridiales bacterium]